MSYTFTPIDISGFHIAMSSNGTIMLSANNSNSVLYVSNNSGVSWTAKVTDTTRAWTSITVSADGTKMAACVYAGNVWVSTDSGSTWTERTGLASGDWLSLAYTRDGTKLFLAGDNTEIYLSTDDGQNFSSIYATTKAYRCIATSNDGNTVVVSVNNNSSVYGIFSGSWTWANIPDVTSSYICAISADGTKILINNASSGGIKYSINSGTSFANATGAVSSVDIAGIEIAADGTRVTCVGGPGGNYNTVYTTSNITSGSWTTTSLSGSAQSLAGNDTLSFIATTFFEAYTQTGVLSGPEPVICFREGTSITTFNPVAGREESTAVENVRPGMLVKTRTSGYVPVSIVGTSTVTIPNHAERTAERLYVCTKDQFPELTRDLYITGHHSILVNSLTDAEREETAADLGRVYVTEGRYRLPAHIDRRAHVYEAPGAVERIWHFALDHNDEQMNYGVYANGLLVESCSIWRLRTMIGYTLIGANTAAIENSASATPMSLPIVC
jgi:hypothetical protein